MISNASSGGCPGNTTPIELTFADDGPAAVSGDAESLQGSVTAPARDASGGSDADVASVSHHASKHTGDSEGSPGNISLDGPSKSIHRNGSPNESCKKWTNEITQNEGSDKDISDADNESDSIEDNDDSNDEDYLDFNEPDANDSFEELHNFIANEDEVFQRPTGARPASLPTENPAKTPIHRPANYALNPKSTHQAQRSLLRSTFDENSFFLLEETTAPVVRSSTPALNISNHVGVRRMKVAGGHIAYSKPVTADLDSDDELMMTMKEQGYTDLQIAQRLARENRVRYDRKSVATRIYRIKNAQAERVDEMLLEGYKEWQLEDDTLLMAAVEIADAEIEVEIEKIRSWRFKKVADTMRKIDPDVIFSSAACQERYSALVGGTATIPIDLDDDPLQRREELQAYQEAREHAREEEREKKARADHIAKMADEASKLEWAKKMEEAAVRRNAKEQAKAQRAADRYAKHQIAAQNAAANKRRKGEKFGKIKAIVDENPVFADPATAIAINVNLRRIGPNTPDPRSFLSLSDLRTLCTSRSLSKEGRARSELVDRLREADAKWTMEDLKSMCRSKGMNTSGNKNLLRHMLAEVEARPFESYKKSMAEHARISAEAMNEFETPNGNGGERSLGDGLFTV
ncbi:hypothetical protein K432DRAFT_408006 [Lepidopterella palustris CBS 459.81]|uniref:SAP domain-containing protein n=1 Tax=Lepidopterella palustris CBS 459.81 TaxID=1314670 RepID=A0A8E2E3B9_9PEZI|nr:hypothetical protein K432DRAFT_408006 [Lepidopterella palustris CBS 459.81]